MSRVQLAVLPIFKPEAVFHVAFYLYRINKLRGISVYQVLYEKWHQIRKAGVKNIISNLGTFYDYHDTERPIGYLQWIQRHERLDAASRQKIFADAATLGRKVCIVCEVRNNTVEAAVETISSLQQQVVEKWQLLFFACEELQDTVQERVGELLHDERISFHVLPTDKKNIIAASLPLMSGDFALWLQAGDRLSPFGLYYWLDSAAASADGVLWYCDSDRIAGDGERVTPHFRPDWNKELYYAINYIEDRFLLRLSTVRDLDVEDLTAGVELYDLVLRLIEDGCEPGIYHLPWVLLHSPLDSPGDANLMERAVEQQRLALQHHFQRLNKGVRVKAGIIQYSHRLEYSLPALSPKVTVIVPTRDKLKLLKKCVNSVLEKTDYPNFDLIVVDNGSERQETLHYFSMIAEDEKVRVIEYDQPFNFAAINNFAVEQTDSEIICLLNNDTEVFSPDWLSELVRYAVQEEIGCVGAKLLYKDKTIQHGGVICGIGNVAGHAHRYLKRDATGYFGRLQVAQYFSAVTAACLAVRRNVYEQVGGMSEQLAVAYNDVDFCLKVKKAGYQNVYTPYAELYHHEYVSRKADDTPEKRARYEQEVEFMQVTWKDELAIDGFYNVNLSRLREDFSL